MTGPDDADELFAEFLAEVEAGTDPDFEALVAGHPGVAGELRELLDLWVQFEGMGQRIAERERAVTGARLEDEPPEVDRYRVDGVVGSGGMGVVFEVRDEVLDRGLAMKVIRTAGEGSEGGSTSLSRSLARFLDEARITSRLAHPGVVPIHDLGRDGRGRAYFTMRLVEGETLAEILRRFETGDPEWSRGRILDVLRRACETMAFAHSRGIIHRDLKPANVMVGAFGEVYVMDWGLARDLSDGDGRSEHGQRMAGHLFERVPVLESGEPLATLDGDVVGTPAYMPPEQARGEIAELSPRADVYALGAMLYHLLAGRAPYAAVKGARAKLDALLAGPPAALGGGSDPPSPELVAIAHRAMEREASRRYADVGELGADLAAFLEGRVVHAYESGPWAEFRKWVGRNRRFAAAAALAALASLAAIGGVFATIFVRDVERKVSERFQDLERLDDLELELDDLWPALPSEQHRLSAFVATAEDLIAKYASLEPPRGEDPVTAWNRSKQVALIEGVRSLAEPDTGAIARVRRRIERADLIRELEQDPAFVAAWSTASARSPGVTPEEPRSGFLPRGPDPETGFEVFEHLPSASRERLGWTVEELLATPLHPTDPGSGVLLVALPATTFDPTRGVDADDLEPWMQRGERTAGPTWCAKYELTVSQAGRLGHLDSLALSPTLPVRSLSAADADRIARAGGLRLPTNDEWLAASSGGEPGAVWWGDDLERWTELEIMREKRAGPEAVGSATVNPYGLYDMLGNVAEWTGDPGRSTTTGHFDLERRSAQGLFFNAGMKLAADLWRLRTAGASYDVDVRIGFMGVRLFADP